MKLAAVTIRRKLAAVRGLYRFLLREGVVRVNIGAVVRTPRPPRSFRSDDGPIRSTRSLTASRRTSSSARSRRATAPFSSCCTAAASA